VIDEFTGGTPEIKDGIGRVWQDRDNWSDEQKSRPSRSPIRASPEFIRKLVRLEPGRPNHTCRP